MLAGVVDKASSSNNSLRRAARTMGRRMRATVCSSLAHSLLEDLRGR